MLFLVSDIFGRTPALEAIGRQLSENIPDIGIIDPYQGVDLQFETEAHAYKHFMDRVGLKNYQSILTDYLTPSAPDRVLIGFSVGASAIWGISGRPPFRHIKKAFCFYGSQIRNETGIHPLSDMEFIFPKQESHFDVDDLIGRLSAKSRVTCTKADGLHGFMNELSSYFDPVCYDKYIRYLKTSLKLQELSAS